MNTTDLAPAWLAQQLAGAEWQTASSGGTNCVEVTFLTDGMIAFRDSLNPHQQPLLITDAGFQSFAVGILSGLIQKPTKAEADPVTATSKNDLDPDWLAGQLAKASWKFAGPGSIGVASLPRAITAFCEPNSNPEQRFLIFADSEITDFYEGIRSGRFSRGNGLMRSPAPSLAMIG